ncbi:hypothetical protein [Pedobacter sp. MR2016-24]|uniref:hypothetical protein n=1 Tax=Pedobacter sp. MR2016-24 TaxID=2994466 RepID=UPI0022470CDD|nr:hypothetical protein [Pedobacter sp. MR2016-24]MCX2486583.1 hypothetical protein [Pedobacter sp. MR2016-24]
MTDEEKRLAILKMVVFQDAIELMEKEENYEVCSSLHEAQQMFEAEIAMAKLLE